jgi:hypothetical protein
MTLFQWLALSLLGVLFLGDLLHLRRTGPVPRVVRLFRCLVWLAAALAITQPDRLTWLARSVGIGRGADVVLYVFVLAFLLVSFYFYSRYVRLQRQMTQLVRHLAIREARHGRGVANGTAANN